MLRAGFIGAGPRAQGAHYPNVRRLKNVEMVAVCELDEARLKFDNGATGVVMGDRASGGRILRSELHGVGIGCYMRIPEEIEILEDNKSRTLGGWEVDGVDKADVDRYEGVLTMHEHFIDCVQNRHVPLTDLRDVIRTVRLVDQIEGPRAS